MISCLVLLLLASRQGSPFNAVNKVAVPCTLTVCGHFKHNLNMHYMYGCCKIIFWLGTLRMEVKKSKGKSDKATDKAKEQNKLSKELKSVYSHECGNPSLFCRLTITGAQMKSFSYLSTPMQHDYCQHFFRKDAAKEHDIMFFS